MTETAAAREQLIAERVGIIGGSDAPAIVRWHTGADFRIPGNKTALSVWARLTGRTEESASEDAPILRRGRRMEPVIRAELEDDAGIRCNTVGSVLIHPERPWQGVHLDGWVSTPERAGQGRGVLEAKAPVTTQHEWEDEAPMHAQIQLAHGMIVSGASWGIVAGWMGMLHGVKWQELDLTDQVATVILEAETALMKLVESDESPGAEAADVGLIQHVFAGVEGSVDLPEEAGKWSIDFERAKQEIKVWEAARDDVKAKLQHAIMSQGGERGTLPDGGGYSYKEQNRKGFTVEPTSFRVLRRFKG